MITEQLGLMLTAVATSIVTALTVSMPSPAVGQANKIKMFTKMVGL
jgi:hypothetical protein